MLTFCGPVSAFRRHRRASCTRTHALQDEEARELDTMFDEDAYRPTRLRAFFALPRTILKDADRYFEEKPQRLLTAGSVLLLVGFFGATSAATIIGSVADWDPLAAAVLLFWTESYTRYYYRAQTRTIAMRLLNSFKIGVVYGMTVEAMKLSS
mmetsp:Transcript_7187/g.21925  ORF Transcript_7187/g.21925 Transcript_7187/m.21925 type:complete len:153 (+) Transcript_7187:231-689(+)